MVKFNTFPNQYASPTLIHFPQWLCVLWIYWKDFESRQCCGHFSFESRVECIWAFLSTWTWHWNHTKVSLSPTLLLVMTSADLQKSFEIAPTLMTSVDLQKSFEITPTLLAWQLIQWPNCLCCLPTSEKLVHSMSCRSVALHTFCRTNHEFHACLCIKKKLSANRSELRSCVKEEVNVLGSPSLIVRTVSAWGHKATLSELHLSELRRCVKEEVDIMGSLSVTVCKFSVDLKQHWTMNTSRCSLYAWKLTEL